MGRNIQHAAVIGAGTMGRQIASLVAGSNTPVLLLDVVPKGANDRDIMAKMGVQQLRNSGVSNRKLELIHPGNIEDDLQKLKQVDWVIECVPEELKTKQDTYEKVGHYVNPSALVSSNTSTIPLNELKKNMNSGLQHQLCITHFFNPPAQLPLLELVTDQDNDPEMMRTFTRFADLMLGRNVVQVKDTPGFIANRIGMFWLLCGMEEALKSGIDIETADAVMNGAFGFPKTGIFALADLIGLKIIPDIAASLCRYLSAEDAFCRLQQARVLVEEQADGDGFYRGKGKEKHILDLQNGQYHPVSHPDITIHHWHEFLKQDLPESRFASAALVRSLWYTATIAHEIADTILPIDAAMCDGYGWQFGPFEMINRLGPAWLAERMEMLDLEPPALLKLPKAQGFYGIQPGAGKTYLAFDGLYHLQLVTAEKWKLGLKTAGIKPVLENEGARLWDIGDGIACLEFSTHMHVINEAVLELLVQSVEKTESEFSGLIIGHDGTHFSAGLDLHVVTKNVEENNWQRIKDILKQGQDAMLRVKYARVPVVPALCGYALGGACELTLQSVAAQAYSGTRIGLVEADIGVIPAWGGTKEHLFRAVKIGKGNVDAILEQALMAFRQIASAQKSADAEEAFAMRLLSKPSQITANRERLLPDAKKLCLALAKKYRPRKPDDIEVPVDALHERLTQEAQALCEQHPEMDTHRKKLLHVLAEALSGFRAVKGLQSMKTTPVGWYKITEQQMLDSTRTAFMELVGTEEALEKIRHVLKK